MIGAIQLPKPDIGPYEFVLYYRDNDGPHVIELGPCYSLYISIKGYKDFYKSGGELVSLEEGHDGLTLYAWAYPKQAEHTHEIPLHLCKEEE